MTPRAPATKELAWLAVPFLAYLALLQALWFDVPVWDDFSVILDATMRLMDARTWSERTGILLSQHNEHRVVVTRALAWLAAELGGGRVDFRWLALLGNLSLAAILALFWAQFRDAADAPLVAGAGFILCQLTFYQGALISMAAISNFGVIAFAFACFFFALRPGRGSVAWALAFGLLATGSLANGLLALPLAAVACALQRRWRRASMFAAAAALLWVAYLVAYQRPDHHPPLLLVLKHPVDAAHLFVVITGSLAPGVWPATVLGAALLAVLGWLTVKGFWRRHPVVALWVAFIVLSALATAVGRVGWGVFHASRYAINSSCLAAIAFLLLVEGRQWSPRSSKAWFAAAALGSLLLSVGVWRQAAGYSFQAELLAKAVPASPDARAEPYFGISFPTTPYPASVLDRSEGRGLYLPPRVRVHGSASAVLDEIPQATRSGGQVDAIQVSGRRVSASGWCEITAEAAGREFAASGPKPVAVTITATSRADLAINASARHMLFAGFLWEADYESEEQARRAAEALCLVVRAPGHPATRLASASCKPSRPGVT